MQCALACTLRVVTMEAVTRLEWLGLARTLRVVAVVAVVAVVTVARLAQCALRYNYYNSSAPQMLRIYMAAAPSAASGLIIRFRRQ